MPSSSSLLIITTTNRTHMNTANPLTYTMSPTPSHTSSTSVGYEQPTPVFDTATLWETVPSLAHLRSPAPVDPSHHAVAARSMYTRPTSNDARALLNEIIASGELPVFPAAFDVYPSRHDHSTRVFRVLFRTPGDAASLGLPREMLLRIVNGVIEPHTRTEREVATLTLLRREGLPVPQVFAFDSRAQNSLGYEWMLTTADPGIPLDELVHNNSRNPITWPDGHSMPTLSRAEEMNVHGQVGNVIDRLDALRFDGVGGLYCHWPTGEYFVGPLPAWTFAGDEIVPQDRTLVELSSCGMTPQTGSGMSRMMHGNLHPSRVLVNAGTLSITAILDWGSAVVAPEEMLPGAPVLEEEI